MSFELGHGCRVYIWLWIELKDLHWTFFSKHSRDPYPEANVPHERSPWPRHPYGVGGHMHQG